MLLYEGFDTITEMLTIHTNICLTAVMYFNVNPELYKRSYI